MTLDRTVITAIATILGVIGGLISVVFLILEVRRNAPAIEGATVQSLPKGFCDMINARQTAYALQ
jgi:hypothetical protein